MISNDKKTIALSEIVNDTTKQFDLATVAGRDAIAEQIAADIDEYCLQTMVDGPRSHLGASVVGHECMAFIWLHFRWMFFEKLKAQQARLFNRGHLEEDRIIEWLRGIGFTIEQIDDNGKQIRIADASGHFGGSIDGNTLMPARYGNFPEKILLEFKTANDKNFQGMSNTGVIKAKPRYWSQMCAYGLKLGIKYCLFIAVNKNNDELDIEVLELSEDVGRIEIEKALYIIQSSSIPPKIASDASYWMCKFCPAVGVCQLNKPAEKNCRSCQFAQPVEDGKWRCNKWNNVIPEDFIKQGCDAWQALLTR